MAPMEPWDAVMRERAGSAPRVGSGCGSGRAVPAAGRGSLLAVALGALLAACGGASSSDEAPTGGATPVATITAPSRVTGGQAGYAASVPAQPGSTYAWTISNGSILVGDGTDSVAFTPGASGTVVLSCTVTSPSGAPSTGSASASIAAAVPPRFNLEQALSDGAQSLHFREFEKLLRQMNKMVAYARKNL